MKKTVLSCCRSFATIAFFFLFSISCVDEKYDLENIDTEVVILKDVAMPIGDLDPIRISDFLNLDESQALMISPDAEGNLKFAFEGDRPLTASFTVPRFDISFCEDGSEERRLSMRIPDELAGMSVDQLETLKPELLRPVSYEDINGSKALIYKTLTVEDDCILPYYIKDVKEVSLESDVIYEFTLDVKDRNGASISAYGGAMYIENGFTIDFPDYFSIAKNDKIDGYEVVSVGNNRNVLQFTKDVKLNVNEPIVIDIFVNKAEIPSGFIVDGGVDSEGRKCRKVWIDTEDMANSIRIEGDVYIDPRDFIKVPSLVEMNMKLAFGSLEVHSALASLNINENIPEQTFKVPEVPEILNAENVVIDIYDPVMTLDVANPSPLDVYLSAKLHGYRDGVELMSMCFGENGADAPLVIGREFDGKIAFSRRGENGMKSNPMIAKLFRTIPDEVKITDANVSVSDDYVEIIPGKSLEFSLDYSFEAPLAFGPDLRMPLEYEIKDLKVDLENFGLKSAKLSFNAVNTIPLALSVGAAVIDADGNTIPDISIEIDGNIGPGTLESPSDSDIVISLKSEGESIVLEGLKLMLEATCPDPACQGKVINKEQGLEIRNLKIALPEGVSMDMKDFMEEVPEE